MIESEEKGNWGIKTHLINSKIAPLIGALPNK